MVRMIKKSTSSIGKKRLYLGIVIFLLSCAMRLYFVIQNTDIPSSDAAVYDKLGLSLAETGGYTNSDGNPHSLYPPFYPFFLSIIYRIFGHNYLAVRIIQAIIGSFSCVLIYKIAAITIDNATGIMASFFALIYYPFIKGAGLLLTENLLVFLFLGTIFFILKILKEDRLRHQITLGILLGLTVLTKSIMLFFPFFLAPFFLFSSLKQCLNRYLVVMSFFIITIFPWALRNFIVFGEFIPISAESGFGLYSSYCPANGIFGLNAAPVDPIVVEAHKISSPSLRNRFFLKKTFQFILANPLRFLVLEFKKIVYFWAPFDWEIVGNKWFNIHYLLLLPFVAVGTVMAFKSFINNCLILLPVIYFQVMTLIFYGSPRFRFLVEPYLFILAAIGVKKLRESIVSQKMDIRDA